MKYEDVLRVTRLVNYEIDPTIDYPRQFVGDVEVTLADGRTIRGRSLPWCVRLTWPRHASGSRSMTAASR